MDRDTLCKAKKDYEQKIMNKYADEISQLLNDFEAETGFPITRITFYSTNTLYSGNILYDCQLQIETV